MSGPTDIPSLAYIGEGAYSNCISLSSLNIPSSVTTIDSNAFSNCDTLKSIILPAGITTIGTGAFESCSSLTSVVIPYTVTTISAGAFAGSNISSVVFQPTPTGYTGSVGCTISDGAFAGNTGITDIILPTYVSSVGAGVFAGSNLTSIVILNPQIMLSPNITSGVTTLQKVLYAGSNASLFFPGITVQNFYCFNKGTKILALNKNYIEEYRNIEDLRKGDYVKSYKHGYRSIDLIGKISMVNEPNSSINCMYKLEKGNATEDSKYFKELTEDLYITGAHSFLIDEIPENMNYVRKIDDKFLMLCSNSKEFTKIKTTDDRYGVWANGILTESTSKNDFLEHNFILLK